MFSGNLHTVELDGSMNTTHNVLTLTVEVLNLTYQLNE